MPPEGTRGVDQAEWGGGDMGGGGGGQIRMF